MSDNMDGFTDSPDRKDESETRRVIGIGMDFEHFLRSDVGLYLQRMAREGIAGLREQIDDLDIETEEGRAEFRRIKLDIAVRKVWKDWLQAAIDDGLAAQQRVTEQGHF